jgi:hypothetical protein
MATNYNFAESSFYPLLKGVTFPGRRFIITVNGSALNLTGATIEADFRYNSVNGEIIKEVSTATSGVTVNDATAGDFQLDTFLMDWDTGTYYYDIKITLSSGAVKKYIWGTIVVNEDTTS